MSQEIYHGIKALCADAQSQIEDVDASDALRLQIEDGAVIVDIRDIRELWRDGGIPDAVHAPRGMLEFWIDPDSPYHKPQFAAAGPFIFCCAGGMRSVLATFAAQQMGLKPVYNLAGGFKAWKDMGGPVAVIERR